jgi:5-methylcytosine-specific restriction endonuclease McrA
MSKKRKKSRDLTLEEKHLRNQKRLQNYNPIMSTRNAIRREFSRSPLVIEMMKENKRHVPKFNSDGSRAKVDAVEHLCTGCKEWKRSSKGNKVAIDHIIPVVDPEQGFIDFNTYFKRMFVSRDNLQKLCGDCHQKKTNEERVRRHLKIDIDFISELESSAISGADLKKSLKRFTKQKLAEYPKEFSDRVFALREKCGKK